MVESLVNYACWDVTRVGEVINREAVEMDAATFMATHLPITDLRYETSEYAVQDTSETGLLNELLRRAHEDKHTFIVLKGIPGTGKSHLIRWLRESYDRACEEQNLSEVTLLIRRANSSLRETLRQIIQANVFDAPIFSSYLQRLQEASNNLSTGELGNRLLNALQEAALAVNEGTYQPSDRPFSKRITKDMPEFLLNTAARDYLQRKDGGIARIVQFLSGAERTAGVGEEMPRFEEDDLDFPVDTLRQLNSADRPAVKNLAGFITTQRREVATYLNTLLNRAVSNLTTITPDQLKSMFGDLRRQLRAEGKNLTLFIEDITAFTGLDAGLIDVLVAQHGADNPEYCRLSTLIGVTDNYYQEQFRENIRQRVTFLVSLNAGDSSDYASKLLQNEDNVVDLAARYLNAIRLSRDSVVEWHNQSGNTEALPIKCRGCPVRTPCHENFGAVNLSENSDSAIGLYPFNATALIKLYRNIDPQRTTQTPRALLNNILGYILSSHTDRILRGTFPPAPGELAPDVLPPNLLKPAQRTLIERKAGSKIHSDRIETLLRFWGDGTADSPDAQTKTLGSLTPVVFEAFGLQFFVGDSVSLPVTPTKVQTLTKSTAIATATRSERSTTDPSVPTLSRNAADIEQWRTGGQLIAYSALVTDLVAFVKSAIPWDLHNISRTLVDERVTQARFEIEGQHGIARTQPRIKFQRSDELALVFHALDNLRYVKKDLTADQRTTDLTALHTWLADNEARIIGFVRDIGNEDAISSPLDYDLAVLQATFGLTAVSGRLSKQMTDGILSELVEFAKKPSTFPNGADNRSRIWSNVLKSTLGSSRTTIVGEFLNTLNCPQGTTTEVRFIDAAHAIELINMLKRNDRLLPASFPETKSPAWRDLITVHDKVTGDIGSALLQSEMEDIQDKKKSLKAYLGDQSPTEVVKALRDFIANKAETLKYSVKNLPTFRIQLVEHFLTQAEIEGLVDGSVQQWRYLSEIGESKQEAIRFLGELEERLKSIESDIARFERLLVDASDKDITTAQQQIDVLIDRMIQSIDELLSGAQHR